MKYHLSPVAKIAFNAIVDECLRHGLPKPRLDWGGRHPRAVLNIDGKERFTSFPCSPSDFRIAQVKARDTRKLIREVRGEAA